ncbi:alpha/beta fold hydrolase [Rhizohabitans arisaemae]|uniref:alpha/beta fold hydrolase n=1 Tax=Rhizohabitans arisaemae TaxID=2720610 RepID=UPI0024B1B326|nr:alpha/beta hydrolase [Rhizohabitans arisaemae]
MPTPTTGVLPVPGARLYHEVRGSGPLLLLIATGNGDATPYGPMADALADRYTVVTYDRRGFSRSPIEGPIDDAGRLAEDVADAVALIDRFSGDPAYVYGACSGATVALALLERAPGRIRRLVAHEPPLASVLPDAEKWSRFHKDLYDVYRASGVAAAKELFKGTLELGESRPPEDAVLPPDKLEELRERLRRNELFWFEHELLPFPDEVIDLAALGAVSDRLVPAHGLDSADGFPHTPIVVVAERLGLPLTGFPGAHLGHVTHPREFAARLASLFR